MSGIDWSKAKDNKIGAFVRSTDGETFFVETKEDHFGMGQKGFIGLSDGREYHVFAHIWTWHERPSSPAWSGPQDGLPPVGLRVEANFVGEWVPFELRYYGEQYVIFKTQFEVQRSRHDFDNCGVQFRAIRTPEQIAAELANQAIKKIAVIICRDGAFDIDDPEVMESAVALYDEGLRFQEVEK